MTCSFCTKHAITALAGGVDLRFCETHWAEYQVLGEAWDGRGERPSVVMRRLYRRN
jgi:hypothetical protein